MGRASNAMTGEGTRSSVVALLKYMWSEETALRALAGAFSSLVSKSDYVGTTSFIDMVGRSRARIMRLEASLKEKGDRSPAVWRTPDVDLSVPDAAVQLLSKMRTLGAIYGTLAEVARRAGNPGDAFRMELNHISMHDDASSVGTSFVVLPPAAGVYEEEALHGLWYDAHAAYLTSLAYARSLCRPHDSAIWFNFTAESKALLSLVTDGVRDLCGTAPVVQSTGDRWHVRQGYAPIRSVVAAHARVWARACVWAHNEMPERMSDIRACILSKSDALTVRASGLLKEYIVRALANGAPV